MTAAATKRPSLLLIFGLPLLIFVSAVAFTFSPLIGSYPELTAAITFDLVISVPLVYFLLIRKTQISRLTVVPFLIGGIFAASVLVPADRQYHLGPAITWLLPVVELAAAGYLIFTARKILRKYREHQKKSADVLAILRQVCRQITGHPLLAGIFAFEMAVIYYGLISWRPPARAPESFTYHRKNGSLALFAVIIFLIAVETIVLHILIAGWNSAVAWILTLLSGYFLLQLLAHLKAVRQRPVELNGGWLQVRYGLFGEADIDLENIEKIEIFSGTPDDAGHKPIKRLTLFSELEQVNVRLGLKDEIEVRGFYGIRSSCRTLLFYVDDPDRLREFLGYNEPD